MAKFRIDVQAVGLERRPLGDDGNEFGSRTMAWLEASRIARLGAPYAGATYVLVDITSGMDVARRVIDGDGLMGDETAPRVIETEGVEVNGAWVGAPEAGGLRRYARDIVSAYPPEVMAAGRAFRKLQTGSAYGRYGVFSGGRVEAPPARVTLDLNRGYGVAFVGGRTEKR